jgi:creatinine amidohydrolase
MQHSRIEMDRKTSMPPRSSVLVEANHRQLTEEPPVVAVLPWGATEAHGWHLPYGTDVIEATRIAERGVELAHERGARVVVLPTIPFGNDEQQLDQAATISIRTATAAAILNDVARSLVAQRIDRLVILNAHGGNQFQPLVRDVQSEHNLLVVVVNFFQLVPDVKATIFDNSGDHADELETSLLLHLCPELVELERAGQGERVPFAIDGLTQPGVWTPRTWSKCHPDTGSGDPSRATAEKGARYFQAVTEAVAGVLVNLAAAHKGDCRTPEGRRKGGRRASHSEPPVSMPVESFTGGSAPPRPPATHAKSLSLCSVRCPDYHGHSRDRRTAGGRIRHHSPTASMISLFPFSKAAFAAIDRQVNEFADMVVNFVELILMSLFW